MNVRISLPATGIVGHWDVEIPDDHAYIKWANEKLDESGEVGWAAVAVFDAALRACVGEDLSVDIIPPPEYPA